MIGEEQMKYEITGAIFDMDGTLIDSMPYWRKLAPYYLKIHGFEPTEELTDMLAEMSVKDASRYICGNYQPERDPDEVFTELWDIMGDVFYPQGLPLKAGIKEFLDYLKQKGVPMAVASASRAEAVSAALKTSGIEEYFDCVITTGEVGKSKHFPDVFDYALNALGTPKETTWIFEDAVYAVKTAKAAGYNCVNIYEAVFGITPARELADVYFDTFFDYPKYF